MKRHWITTFAILCTVYAAVFVASADEVPSQSLQNVLKSKPKISSPTATTSIVTVDDATGNIRRFGLMSTARLVPVATYNVSGTIKVGTGLAMDSDGKLNNTGLSGVASFNGRAGAVKPGFSDYSASMVKGLATVAKTGAYSDLTGKPTIPPAQVNSDWSAGSGAAQILNKPTIPTALSQLSTDSTHRTVTDAEKVTWNSNVSSVNSVNGHAGTVTLTATDVGADPLGAATSVAASLGTAAAKDVPATGNASATQVVMGNDDRIKLVGGSVVPPPVGFPITPPLSIYKGATGYWTDYNITAAAPTGKTYYVAANGNDSNDGLTPETPLIKISTAITKTDVDVVVVAPGVYVHNFGWEAANPTRNVSVKAAGPGVYISKHSNLTWSADGSNPGAYSAARSAVYAVYDAATTDAVGDYQQLTHVGSAALVGSTAGSWYTDNTTVWVHLAGGRAPDTQVRAFLAAANGGITSPSANRTIYMEGLEFHGGTYPYAVSNSGANSVSLYIKDCKFKYGQLDGLHVTGRGTVYSQGSIAARNLADGFNYHIGGSYLPFAVEINNIGRDNGYAGGDNRSNGSTVHEGISIVRLNGRYTGNYGPNVADINGASAWNVGCTAGDSKTATTAQNVNYQIEGNLWCEGCLSYKSSYGLGTDLTFYGLGTGTGSNVHANNFGGNSSADSGAGTVRFTTDFSQVPVLSSDARLYTITDSTSTTSSTTAASATAIKAVNDLANSKLSPTGSGADLTGITPAKVGAVPVTASTGIILFSSTGCAAGWQDTMSAEIAQYTAVGIQADHIVCYPYTPPTGSASFNFPTVAAAGAAGVMSANYTANVAFSFPAIFATGSAGTMAASAGATGDAAFTFPAVSGSGAVGVLTAAYVQDGSFSFPAVTATGTVGNVTAGTTGNATFSFPSVTGIGATGTIVASAGTVTSSITEDFEIGPTSWPGAGNSGVTWTRDISQGTVDRQNTVASGGTGYALKLVANEDEGGDSTVSATGTFSGFSSASGTFTIKFKPKTVSGFTTATTSVGEGYTVPIEINNFMEATFTTSATIATSISVTFSQIGEYAVGEGYIDAITITKN